MYKIFHIQRADLSLLKLMSKANIVVESTLGKRHTKLHRSNERVLSEGTEVDSNEALLFHSFGPS